MTVYVDELMAAPDKPDVPICFRGRKCCHMATDGPIEELHAMADKIGLKRAWFQGGRLPHYDLVPSKRAAALKAGAVEIRGPDMAARCWLKERAIG